MSYTLTAFLFIFGLMVGMLVLLEIGRRIGNPWLAEDSEGAQAGNRLKSRW